MTGSYSKPEILTGPERRRRRTPAEKLAIIAETREPGMTVVIGQCRPDSRGSIHIKSAIPGSAPAIRPNFLSAQTDRDATVAGNALLINGLMLSAFALDGLAHAVEALCGHAIGARDRLALRRSLVVAGGWSLIASLGFALLFLLAGHLFRQLAFGR